MKPNLEEIMKKFYPKVYGVERQPLKNYLENNVEIKVYPMGAGIQGKYYNKALPLHLRSEEDRNIKTFLKAREN